MITDQVKRRKEAFILRLQKNLKSEGTCLSYTGATRGGRSGPGYPTTGFRVPGQSNGKDRGRVQIGVHRLFLILLLYRPIRKGYEAGHTCPRNDRSCVVHVQEMTHKENMRRVGEFRRYGENCPF